VTAIVSLKLGENPPTVGDIRDFMRDEYAGYKCPKTLVVVEEVRRSPAGKQDYAWAKSLVNAQLVRADKD
jgi:acyl-CoA synthetase (AMP-forming)/AMP-acid ligase II